VRDLQQSGLCACASLDRLVEALSCLDALADIPDDAQQARQVLKGECRPMPIGMKRSIVHAYMQQACVKKAAISEIELFMINSYYNSIVKKSMRHEAQEKMPKTGSVCVIS
jgi:hypothetical protein